MTDSDRTRVRLHGPEDLVAAVPYLLGFVPTDSLVVIGLGGDPRTVRLTARIDLPRPADRRPAAELLVGHLIRAGADGVAAVLYPPARPPRSGDLRRGGRPGTSDRRLLLGIRAAARARRLEVVDLLVVRDGRWWSEQCTEPGCCPPGGHPLPTEAATELAVASTLAGDVVQPSRAALVATLEPTTGSDRRTVASAFAHVAREMENELSRRGWDAVAADSVDRLSAAIQARVESPTPLRPAEVARLALGLADVTVRDAALRWVDGESAGAAEGLWAELTRRAVPPYDAAPATLLAVHAYLRGNGAYARIALDRALSGDPGYTLAGLLAGGLDGGVPPSVLRASLLAAGT